jgi:CO/xanthine dehydrogenase Mo-binding subunit
VAIQDGPTLRVWSHSQGINPLRRELATLLGIDADDIVVTHTDGPGCYGFNGADDAAALAAIAARSVPGRHVRLRFSVDDEFGWEPLGPAMLADLEAGIGPDGDVLAWRHRAISGVHSMRPDGSGDRFPLVFVQLVENVRYVHGYPVRAGSGEARRRGGLFHRHRLGKISRLVHVGALEDGHVIREHL